MKHYFYKRQQTRGNVTTVESFRILYGNPVIKEGEEKNLWEVSGDARYSIGILSGQYCVGAFLKYTITIMDGITGEVLAKKHENIAPLTADDLKEKLTDVWSNRFNPEYILGIRGKQHGDYIAPYAFGFYAVSLRIFDDHKNHIFKTELTGVYTDSKLAKSLIWFKHYNSLVLLRLKPFRFHGLLQFLSTTRYTEQDCIHLRELELDSVMITSKTRIDYDTPVNYLLPEATRRLPIPNTDILDDLASPEAIERFTTPVWKHEEIDIDHRHKGEYGSISEEYDVLLANTLIDDEDLEEDDTCTILVSDSHGAPIFTENCYDHGDELVYEMRCKNNCVVRLLIRDVNEEGENCMYFPEPELTVEFCIGEYGYVIYNDMAEVNNERLCKPLDELEKIHFSDDRHDEIGDSLEFGYFPKYELEQLLVGAHGKPMKNVIHELIVQIVKPLHTDSSDQMKNQVLRDIFGIFSENALQKKYMELLLKDVVHSSVSHKYSFDNSLSSDDCRKYQEQIKHIGNHITISNHMGLESVVAPYGRYYRLFHDGSALLKNRESIGQPVICTNGFSCNIHITKLKNCHSVFIYDFHKNNVASHTMLRFQTASDADAFMDRLPELVDPGVETATDVELLQSVSMGNRISYYKYFVRNILRKYNRDYSVEYVSYPDYKTPLKTQEPIMVDGATHIITFR